MKALVEAALVGLGRAGPPPAAPDDPGEHLLARSKDLAPERALLLRMGVRAVRARAGFTPARGAERPEAAPPEPRPPCSPALAAIVAELCGSRHKTILGEALARIDARGLRLPSHVTPALAALREPRLLPAASSVAGERGRWLARHNPAWRWLVDGVAPASLEDRRRIWDEGLPDARMSALRATRLTHPAEARTWIEAVWKEENASVREEMVSALVGNLSADDEPLLGRRWRTGPPASGAPPPDCSCGSRPRPCRRACAATRRRGPRYTPPGTGVLGALKSRLAGRVTAEPPSVSPPTAFAAGGPTMACSKSRRPERGNARSGCGRSFRWSLPPLGTAVRCLRRVLLMAATKREWAEPVLAGWTDAAVRFEARPWAEPLGGGRGAPGAGVAGLAGRGRLPADGRGGDSRGDGDAIPTAASRRRGTASCRRFRGRGARPSRTTS